MVTCKICGSGESTGSFVYCMRCYTPHHADCWEYNKICSVFACGSRSQSGYYPPPPEVIAIEDVQDLPVIKKENPFWTHLGIVLIAMFAIGFGVLMGVLAVGAVFGSIIPHDPIIRFEDRIELPQNNTGESLVPR